MASVTNPAETPASHAPEIPLKQAAFPFAPPYTEGRIDRPFDVNAPEHLQNVYGQELIEIQKRRARNGRPAPAPLVTDQGPSPTAAADLVGVACSGGGVRSAAFCLGALQALHQTAQPPEHPGPDPTDLPYIDYISTVSGGGYTGAALSIGMTNGRGTFPFGLASREPGETPATQHIRDNTKYLVPQGWRSILSFAVIYMRGLAVSVLAVLPFMLLFAAVLIAFAPTSQILQDPWNGARWNGNVLWRALHGWFTSPLIVLAVLILICAILVSIKTRPLLSLRRRNAKFMAMSVLVALGVPLAITVNIAVLGWISFPNKEITVQSSVLPTWLSGMLNGLASSAPLLAAIAAALMPFVSKLARIAAGKTVETYGGRLAQAASKLTLLVGAALLPLALWLAALLLTRTLILTPDTIPLVWKPAFMGDYRAAGGAVLTAISLLLVWQIFNINSNSLHQVYRDRLSSAFIQTTSYQETLFGSEKHKQDARDKLNTADRFMLSAIDTASTPYHLINSALNVPGSAFANKRGRNAEFFMFSPKHLGSEVTGYVDIRHAENKLDQIDLGTVMAISGAAVAPNMGMASVAPLSPTLALLNIRLGRWIRQPQTMVRTGYMRWYARWRATPGPWHLWMEAFSKSGRFIDRLRGINTMQFLTAKNMANAKEDITNAQRLLFLTDGGHIENLGIYELLRRRCKLIIAIDAEQDPELRCSALAQVERFARIDLGTRIDIDTRRLAESHKQGVELIDKNAPLQADRPASHVALGLISYPRLGAKNAPEKAVLIYVKPTLSGDENSYVRAYRQKNRAFPHETTGDQFFSEEQFEVYRALGEHILRRALEGQDCMISPSWLNAVDQEFIVEEARRLLNQQR